MNKCEFKYVRDYSISRIIFVILKLMKYLIEQWNIFFKVTTTSEEKSVTESMDSTVKSKDSASESEEEEKEETLREKIDRLALENSENDEDFDVSNQVYIIFLFNIRCSFFHPGCYYSIHSRFKRRFTFTINLIRRKLDDLTLLRQIARSGFDDTPLASFIFLVRWLHMYMLLHDREDLSGHVFAIVFSADQMQLFGGQRREQRR